MPSKKTIMFQLEQHTLGTEEYCVTQCLYVSEKLHKEKVQYLKVILIQQAIIIKTYISILLNRVR